ncbi:ribonuclease J [Sedimentibacter sp. zth1]|uniref:ribonuclease J n=1 Tax=Sedimentibacter sp. zth1 TaxID=2816908 RepID=UPI001A92331D|nr:ribonuclease J [Sedimentibacter sp. zth1]QSX06438.1 ribonuclease J [Sedimentibacter sp. zth1]
MAQTKKNKLKIIPLGGLGEIGKNITAIEYNKDIIVIDCGMAFPEDEMLGIDIVIPDVTYLIKNKDRVRGLFLTHGHEDHIGGIPYVLKKINIPVYGTRLTIGLVENKLLEHKLEDVSLNVINPGEFVKLGCFKVNFIRTNHSIPDSVGFAIETPMGTVVHTGDFKIDYTPIKGEVIDLNAFAQYGKKGVLVAMCDSTNVERPGFTQSERTVGYKFMDVFKECKHRIIVATFASNIHRVQQIVNAAVLYNRKVAISGRSMVNVVKVAQELGYLDVPEGTIININDLKKYKDEEIALITTGSQGEPMSALTRMANNDHKKVVIKEGDMVIISASPIPGNEKTVARVINLLYKKGADVLYDALEEIHVSGHARQEELKLMLSLLKPKFFMPVHGEYRHLRHHAKLAMSLGIEKSNILIAENGNVLEFNTKSGAINGSVQSGKILVDGLGVGDVGNIVLRDRKHLSENGLIIAVITIDKKTGEMISGPDIVSRGFIYVRENIDLIEESKIIVKTAFNKCKDANIKDWSSIKAMIKDDLSNFIYEKIKRSPMILPIIMEVSVNERI